MKKKYHRKAIFIIGILFLVILGVTYAEFTSKERYLNRDLHYYWNLSTKYSDKQILFSYYDAYSKDAYYVLDCEKTYFDLTGIKADSNVKSEISVKQGTENFFDLQKENNISAEHLINLENVPLEYVPPSYLDKRDTKFQYTLLKRYVNNKYEGFLLVLSCEEENRVYLMQCVDV